MKYTNKGSIQFSNNTIFSCLFVIILKILESTEFLYLSVNTIKSETFTYVE